MDTEERTKSQVYREHVLKAQDFLGSDREYCRLNGLNAPIFYSYKSKMGLSRKAFVRIKQSGPDAVESSWAPDAKWTAEFLRYFLNS